MFSLTKNTPFFTLLFAVLVVLSSCGGDDHAKLIPKDANVVLTIDMGTLKSKTTDFSKVMKYLQGDLDENAKKIMNSGIDISGKAYAFGVLTENETGNLGGTIFPIEDAAKFKSFVSEEMEEFQILQEGDWNYAYNENDMKTCLAWNDKVGSLINMSRGESIDATKAKVLEILTTSGDNSLAQTSETFKTSQKKGGDLGLWLDIGSVKDIAPKAFRMSELETLNEEIDLSDTYASAQLNFEEGQVVFESQFIASEELKKLISGTIRSGVNGNVADEVPGEGALAFYGLAIDMPRLVEELKAKELDQFIDQTLGMAALSTDELPNILTGDILATVNGVNLKENRWGGKDPEPDFSVAIGIKDKKRIEEFMDFALHLDMGLTQEDGYYSFDQMKVFVRDNAVVVAGMSAFGDKVKAGEVGKFSSEHNSIVTSNGMSIVLDLSAGIPSALKENAGPFEKQIAEFEKIEITSNLNSGDTEMKAVLTLKTKDENSISVLSRIGKEMEESM